MSADNWRICPKCEETRLLTIQLSKDTLKKKYGKVSADEYEKMRSNVEAAEHKTLEETLREDYELGVDGEGVFGIVYSAACQKCNYMFRYEHSQKTL